MPMLQSLSMEIIANRALIISVACRADLLSLEDLWDVAKCAQDQLFIIVASMLSGRTRNFVCHGCHRVLTPRTP
eukprot:3110752-Amphidinium_carterae.1